MSRYSIVFGGGPPIRDLIADAGGEAALVEYGLGEMHVIYSETPWQLATNLLLESAVGDPENSCWRYGILKRRVTATAGNLSSQAAKSLLEQVSQEGSSSTLWSAVYELSTHVVNLALGREYQKIYRFQLQNGLQSSRAALHGL
jgi:hypothetical protein